MINMNKFLIIITLISIASIIFNVRSCNKIDDLKTENSVKEQNIEALKDTVKDVKNLADELQQEKLSLITTKKNLINKNNSLASELEKQKGKVIYLSQMNGSLKVENDELKEENKKAKRDKLKKKLEENQ